MQAAVFTDGPRSGDILSQDTSPGQEFYSALSRPEQLKFLEETGQVVGPLIRYVQYAGPFEIGDDVVYYYKIDVEWDRDTNCSFTDQGGVTCNRLSIMQNHVCRCVQRGHDPHMMCHPWRRDTP